MGGVGVDGRVGVDEREFDEGLEYTYTTDPYTVRLGCPTTSIVDSATHEFAPCCILFVNS